MIIRSRIFPKELISISAFLFVACAIPLAYWFEICVVLPSLYDMQSPSFWMHIIFGHFLMFNVTGSYMGLLFVDNSVERHALSQQNVPHDWRHCNVCNIKVPPRASHCSVCNECMLKRDHHCLFTGYCIGHHNHRLFMLFVFYLLVSCVYITFYNCYFLTQWISPTQLLFRTIFSVPLIVFEQKIDITHLYLLTFYIIIGGGICSLVALIYHGKLVVQGCVGYERKHNILQYNFGLKQNFINVFGERWYLAWLSPFISSKLPTDGFHWDIKTIQTKEL